jgi:hypothetical protein
VLLVLGMLVFLGAMVPQVLVQASLGIRHDRARDALAVALDTAIAFTEARVKHEVGEALRLERIPEDLQKFTVRPSQESPDHGAKHRIDWEARLFHFKPHDLAGPEGAGGEERYSYAYGLMARAWETGGARREESLQVTGLMTLVLSGHGAERTVTDVAFEPLATSVPAPQPSVAP